jgi:lipoprotein-anchoring transpeptidase ErfK/SrfK
MGARTPEGTTNVVLARRRADRDGRLWVRVAVPGATGWVPRAALGGYGVVRTRLVVDRRRLTATLLRDGRPAFRARVAVGRRAAPTPAGAFYVRDRLTRYARSPVYGPVAFGTSATSPTLTDWPAGGFVGIHGTDRPDLIPGRVSHGCIRMRNRDIRRLARLMPVGTPVRIR